MEAAASSQSCEARPTYRCWVGVVLSFFIPGAGIYLAGDKGTGFRWFFGLMAISLIGRIVSPSQAISGLFVFALISMAFLVLFVWMLVQSYRPVPRVGILTWLCFFLLIFALGATKRGIFKQWPGRLIAHGPSMNPTIAPGDRLLVDTFAYWSARPKHGDVVVFKSDPVEALPRGRFRPNASLRFLERRSKS